MQFIRRTTSGFSRGLRRTARGLTRRMGYEVSRIQPFQLSEKLVFSQIPGWFSQKEAELLYLLGFMSRGRVLEIGHFLGRSTSAICQGIRDSGRSVEFNSYDIGIASEEELLAFYTKLYNDLEWKDYPRDIYNEWVYAKKASVTELAKANLAKYNLDKHVNLHKGDFSELDHTRYDLIFCDAMHDAHEIKHNLPLLLGVSQSICTLAFHDMIPAAIESVLASAPVKFITRADSLARVS